MGVKGGPHLAGGAGALGGVNLPVRGGAKKGGSGRKKSEEKGPQRGPEERSGGPGSGGSGGWGQRGGNGPPGPPQILTCGSLCSGAK